MKSAAKTLYESELEQQVWNRDKIITELIMLLTKQKKLLEKNTIGRLEDI